MKKDSRSRADLWKIWAPLLALVLLGFGVAIVTLEPAPPQELKIATGGSQGAYYAFAERYREILARHGYRLEVVETAGSIENLRLLREGEVSLALLQGGTADEAAATQFESLASLFFEPLWVFTHRELPVNRLNDLRGHRLAVGAPGSGTRTLTLQLLAANGIDGDTAELHEIGSVDAVAGLEDGTVEAAFFVSSANAPFIEQLLRRESLELLTFRRHRAYCREYPFLSAAVLGEGVVDLEENLPSEDVTLLAAAAGLVGRRDLHKALIPLLLEAMDEVHGGGGLFEEPGLFPSTRFVELPLNPEARHYLERGPSFLHRFLPFRHASAIDRLKILLLPFITLLIPVFKAAPPLYRWRIRSKIYRWYEDLRLADEILHSAASGKELDKHLRALRKLEREVTTAVSVPLAYMDEFYRLRDHIELILGKLERLNDGRDEPAGGDGEAG
ncbi:MAG: TAXI family TRAP transporter solute-binding subunit [bacterium]|nr:TAXI family TRAP transporter solute-binding subunit [bacterium]